MSHQPHAAPALVLVGGFLGAGKTTLILAGARLLASRGLKSAVILNDQGDSLVDTQLARHHGLEAGEVTGGCFCCRFSDLVDSAVRLRAHSPDVIFAEPVGSCTDLVSTVIDPLREAHAGQFRLTPFTVCVDPARAREMERADSNPHLAFLFRNQVAEADLVCYSKADVDPDWIGSSAGNARYLSARTGLGVAAWLDEILSGRLAESQFGNRLDLDYEVYARAEAALAWLNFSATVDCEPSVTAAALIGPLLDRIAAEVEIVHLKAIDQNEAGFLKAALCGSREEPQIEGPLDASPARRHRILLNLRAVSEDPAPVGRVVEKWVQDLASHRISPSRGIFLERHLACFTPAPPRKPERRLPID